MAGVPPAVAQMVASLEARLNANPERYRWLVAARAFLFSARAATSNPLMRTSARTPKAAVKTSRQRSALPRRWCSPTIGRSRRARRNSFERAYERAPHHPKALWYSGLAAYQSGRLDVARERWMGLVALNPPPEIKQVLETKIAELDTQLNSSAAASGAAPADSPVV